MIPRRVDPSEQGTLEAMDGVMQRAYRGASFRTSIQRFVAVQPDGLAVIELDERVVGTGCCIAYPDGGFGWIGLIATEPGYERRGIATAITDHLSAALAEHGCAPVLDASLAGGPVYERMGFADHGLTTVLSPGDGSIGWPHSVELCVPIGGEDLDEIVAYDAQHFGARRPKLLEALIRQHPDRGFAARRNGELCGYLIAQEATLAPVIADDGDALAALVVAARDLSWPAPPRINAPPESRHIDTLLALGFERRRELRHMQRGVDALPGGRQAIAGMVSLGEG